MRPAFRTFAAAVVLAALPLAPPALPRCLAVTAQNFRRLVPGRAPPLPLPRRLHRVLGPVESARPSRQPVDRLRRGVRRALRRALARQHPHQPPQVAQRRGALARQDAGRCS